MVGASGPLLDRHRHLGNPLDLEEPPRPLFVYLIEARIHFPAHGVSHHTHKTAHARAPNAPGNSIERGGTKERSLKTACEPLCRGDADAHTRERSGAAPHEHHVHVGHGLAGGGQHLLAGAHELLVGMTPTQAVTRGQHAQPPARRDGGPRARSGNLAHRTCQHVRGRVNCEHESLLASCFSHEEPFCPVQRKTV